MRPRGAEEDSARANALLFVDAWSMGNFNMRLGEVRDVSDAVLTTPSLRLQPNVDFLQRNTCSCHDIVKRASVPVHVGGPVHFYITVNLNDAHWCGVVPHGATSEFNKGWIAVVDSLQSLWTVTGHVRIRLVADVVRNSIAASMAAHLGDSLVTHVHAVTFPASSVAVKRQRDSHSRTLWQAQFALALARAADRVRGLPCALVVACDVLQNVLHGVDVPLNAPATQTS